MPEPVGQVGPRTLRAFEHPTCKLKQTVNISVTGRTKTGASVKEGGQITLSPSDSQDPNDTHLPLPRQQKRHAQLHAGGEAHAFRRPCCFYCCYCYLRIFVSAMRLYAIGLMLWCLTWHRAHDAMAKMYLAVYLQAASVFRRC